MKLMRTATLLDRYFFAVSAPGFKIHLDPHASESYDQITSVEDEALEAAVRTRLS